MEEEGLRPREGAGFDHMGYGQAYVRYGGMSFSIIEIFFKSVKWNDWAFLALKRQNLTF